MLDRLRSGARSPIVWVILALLVLGLIFTGGGTGGLSGIFGPGANEVARVGSQAVPIWATAREFDDVIREQRERDGEFSIYSLPRDQQALVLDQTYQRVVQNARFSAEAERIGVDIAPASIGEVITSADIFKDAGDQFNEALYQEYVRQFASYGMGEREFELQMEQDIVRSMLLNTASVGLYTPDLLATQRLRSLLELRMVSMVVVPDDPNGVPGVPTDAQLQDVYEINKGVLGEPERRTVSMMIFDIDVDAAVPLVPASEVDVLFEDRLAAASTPERRTITEVFAPDEATARLLTQRLREGIPPQSLVDGTPGVALERHELVTELDLPDAAMAAAAFALDADGVSDPVQTSLSWSVVRVDEVEPGTTADGDAVRAAIIQERATLLAEQQRLNALRAFEGALDRTGNFDDAVAASGRALVVLENVDDRGLTAAGERPSSMAGMDDGAYATLMQESFSRRAGLTSQTLTAGDDLVVLRVDGVVPGYERPLDEVREAVVEIWRRTAAANLQQTRAEAAQDVLRNGGSLAQALLVAGDGALGDSAALYRYAVVTDPRAIPDNVSRRAAVSAVQLNPGETSLVTRDDGALVVLRVEAVLPAPPLRASGAELASVKADLGQAVANDLIQAYYAGLVARFPDKRNQRALEAATVSLDR